jgi:DNA-binding CsgD family transcriptional regulator
MDYWEAILDEVMHSDDDAFHFKFTDLGRSLVRDRHRKYRQTRHEREKPVSPTYYLGAKFPNIYFTKREAETLYFLLQGKTIVETGDCLNLSARTIEFYVKNMKLKVGVKSKVELLEKIRDTAIIKQLHSINIGTHNDN